MALMPSECAETAGSRMRAVTIAMSPSARVPVMPRPLLAHVAAFGLIAIALRRRIETLRIG
jgi:hypothetical protein